MLDTRKTTNAFVPVKVSNKRIELRSNLINYKLYLGTLIQNKLSFSDNTGLIYLFILKKITKKKNHSNADLLMSVMSCYKLCTKV